MSDSDLNYISLSDAAKYSEIYSQEYLSLRARQGKFKATKLGRNWVTTKQWVDDYIHLEKNVKANGVLHEEIKKENLEKFEKENLIFEKPVFEKPEIKIQPASAPSELRRGEARKYIFKFALASSITAVLIFSVFIFKDKIIKIDKTLDAKFISVTKNISENIKLPKENYFVGVNFLSKADLVFADLKDSFLKQNNLAVKSILNGIPKSNPQHYISKVNNYLAIEKQRIKFLTSEYKLFTQEVEKIKQEISNSDIFFAVKELKQSLGNGVVALYKTHPWSHSEGVERPKNPNENNGRDSSLSLRMTQLGLFITKADKTLDTKFLSLAKSVPTIKIPTIKIPTNSIKTAIAISQEITNKKIDQAFSNLKDSFLQQNDLAVSSVKNYFVGINILTKDYPVRARQQIVLVADGYQLSFIEINRVTVGFGERALQAINSYSAVADNYFSAISILVKSAGESAKEFARSFVGDIKTVVIKSQETTNEKAGLVFADLRNSFLQQNDLVALGVSGGFKNIGDGFVILREWSDRRILTAETEIPRLYLGMTESGHFVAQNLKDYLALAKEKINILANIASIASNVNIAESLKAIQRPVDDYFYGIFFVAKDYLALEKQNFISAIKDYKLSTVGTTKEIGKEILANALAATSNIKNNIKDSIQEGLAITKQKTKDLFANIKALTIYIVESAQKGFYYVIRPWLEDKNLFLVQGVKETEFLKTASSTVIIKETVVIREKQGSSVSTTQITQIFPIKEITKETIIVEKAVEARFWEPLKTELQQLKLAVANLQSQAGKIQYYSPSNNVPTSPVYIGSSGLEISGNASLASLGVSGFAGIRDLGVGNSFSVGSGGTTLTVDKEGRLTSPSITGGSGSFSSLSSTGNITATGDLAVSGSATIAGNLNVGGIAVFSTSTIAMTTTTASIFSIGTSTTANLFTVAGTGNTVFQNIGQVYILPTGTTTIGAGTSTPTVLTGYIASDILPYYDNTYNIGSSDYRWKQGYFGDSLSVNGTSTLATTTATLLSVSGNGMVAGYFGIGTSTPYYPLDISSTSTITSSSAKAQNIYLTANPSATSSASYYGSMSIADYQANYPTNSGYYVMGNWGEGRNSGTSTLENVVGGWFRAANTSSGTVNDANGVVGQARNSGTGTIIRGYGVVGAARNNSSGVITDAVGVWGDIINANASGVITNAYNIRAAVPYSNVGTIQNLYGVYIDAQSPTGGGTINNKWAFYQAGSSDQSYFAGNVGIGTTTPTALLNVYSSKATAYPLLRISTTTVEALFVDTSGNVGIGTTTIAYKFFVDGNSYISGNSTSTGNSQIAGNLQVVGSQTIGSTLNVAATSTQATTSITQLLVSGYGSVLGSFGVGTSSAPYKLTVEGDSYFIGNATTTGDFTVNGNLKVAGNTITLGDSFTSDLVVNTAVASDLIPDENATRDLGSTNYYWDYLYVDQVVANNISAASTTVGGTQSESFTLNSDNGTADTESQSLIFFRGQVVPNAVLSWDAGADKFDFNQPVFMQNDSSTTTVPSLEVWGKSGQTADLFRVASSSGAVVFNVASSGNVGIGTSTPSFLLTTAGTQYTTGATYFGSTLNVSATTTVATTSITQLLVSGNSILSGGLWVSGTSTLLGDVSITNNLLVSDDLTVTATTTLNGDVVLGSDSNDNIAINGRVGTTTFIGGITVGGDLVANLDFTASGTSTLATTSITQLTTSGHALFSGNVSIATSSSSFGLTTAGTQYTTGATYFGSTLNVAATSTLATTSITYLTASVGGSVMGRFGIGTTTPYYSLDIQSTSGLGSFRIASSSVYNALLIDNNGLMTFGLADNSSTSMTIQEGTSGTAYLTFDTSNDAEKIVVGKDLEIGTMRIDQDSGAVQIANMNITTSSTINTAESLSIALDGVSVLTVYGEADGVGYLQNYRVGIGTTTPISMLTIIGSASSSASSLLKIATSTITAMFIDGMGLVGIGTTSPSFTLTNAGTFYSTGASYFGSTLNIVATSTQATTSITQLLVSGNSILSGGLWTSGTSTLATTSITYLTASVGGSVMGRFGIGTTTPYYSLDIQSTSGLGSFRIASSSVYNALLIDNNGLMTFGLGDHSSSSLVIQEGTSGTAYLTFDTSNDAEKIVVGKNLEIGPMNVDQDSGAVLFATMDVTASSTAGIANSLSIGIDGNSILTVYSSSTGNGQIEQMRVGIGTTTPIAMLELRGNASTTGDLFRVSTSTIYGMVIDGMGLVGIGTSSPTFNLTVAGTQYTTGAAYLSSTLNVSGTSTLATTSITYLTVSQDATIGGKLGIGTTTPYTTFDLKGTASIDPFRIASSTGNTLLKLSNTGALSLLPADGTTVEGIYMYPQTNGNPAKIVIGNSGTSVGTNPAFEIHRVVTGATNAHGIQDYSDLNMDADMAYASHDSRVNLIGSNAIDHFVSFQAVPIITNTGIVSSLYSLWSAPVISAGTTTNSYGIKLDNPALSGSAVVTNNYGLYVSSQTAGSANNYAVYTAGTAASLFGGNVGIGITPTYALHISKASPRIYVKDTGTSYSMAQFSNGSTGDFYIGKESSTGGSIITGSYGNAGVINVSGAFPFQLATNGTIRMTVASSTGNVGMGTTTPAALLDIYGTAGPAQLRISTSTGWAQFYVDNSGYLNIETQNSTTSALQITNATVVANQPLNLNMAGDLGLSYDIMLENPSASYIKFAGAGFVQTESPFGNYNLTLSAANTGKIVLNDNIQITGTTQFVASSTVQALASSSAIIQEVTLTKIYASSSLILSSAPTIADGVEGDIIVLLGASTTQAVTVQDQDTLASSNLQLGSTNRMLTNGSTLALMFDGTDWVELWYSGITHADFAEMYKIKEDVEIGDVVAFSDEYLKTRKASLPDQTLVGIISASPAYLIGNEFKNEMVMPVALNGRVPVKISLEAGAIQKGDLLILSTKPGYAMKYNEDYLRELKALGSLKELTIVPIVGVALEDYVTSSEKIQPEFLEIEYKKVAIQFKQETDEAIKNTILAKYKINSNSEVRASYIENLQTEEPIASINIVGSRVERIANPDYSPAKDDKIMAMVKSGYVKVGPSNGFSKLTVVEKDGKLVFAPEDKNFADNLDMVIEADGSLVVGKLKAKQAEIGSAEKPAGITLYDEDTGAPYCLKMKAGAMISQAGKCGELGAELLPSSGGSSLAPSEPVPEPEISPIDPISPIVPPPILPEPVISEPPIAPAPEFTPEVAPETPPVEQPAPEPEISPIGLISPINQNLYVL
ncbi:MAG: hypothetical protein Q7R99_02185 [bacterium]|nr:hypothetical protein [bacterium]